MPNNITGFGIAVHLVASKTFPTGVQITRFADDADPLDFPAVKIGDSAMGLNGDLITWSKAIGLPMVLNVIPGSDDDVNLSILANANRVAQGKISADDVFTAVVTYPDGRVITRVAGIITDAPFGNSVSSAGRQKTKQYSFIFEDQNGA